MRWSILLALLAAGCSGPSDSRKAETPAKPAYFQPDPASAAAITGKVSFAGAKPAPKPINMAAEEAECLRLHKSKPVEQDVLVNDNGTLANVFVYVKSGLEGKMFPPLESKVRIDQTGCNFVPRVFGMRAGQALEVVNSDPVSHNIHPIPKNNREWNQQQAPGAEPLEREFARSEIMIPVKCNIHSWMKSWIGVIDHPYFAVTGPEGAFEILNLPPGDYTVEAWHEVFGAREQKVKLAPSASASIDFSFK